MVCFGITSFNQKSKAIDDRFSRTFHVWQDVHTLYGRFSTSIAVRGFLMQFFYKTETYI